MITFMDILLLYVINGCHPSDSSLKRTAQYWNYSTPTCQYIRMPPISSINMQNGRAGGVCVWMLASYVCANVNKTARQLILMMNRSAYGVYCIWFDSIPLSFSLLPSHANVHSRGRRCDIVWPNEMKIECRINGLYVDDLTNDFISSVEYVP